jgi:hypothetical protein
MLFKRSMVAALLSVSLSFVGSAQDLFKLNFVGSQRFLNSRGMLATHKLTELDLIAHCVGTNVPATNSSFELAYDASADSIDVVQTNGSVVCELWHLVTVVTNSDGHRLDRFVYLMSPDETNAVGSGIISQKIKNRADIYSISGRLQFFFGTDQGLEDTNSIIVTNIVVVTNTIVVVATNGISGTNTNTIIAGTNSTTTNGTTGVAITTPTTPTAPGGLVLTAPAGANAATAISSNSVTGTISSNAVSTTLGPPPLPSLSTVIPSTHTVAPATLGTTKAELLSTNTPPVTNSVDNSSDFSAGQLPLNVSGVRMWYGTFSAGRRIISATTTNTP